MDEEWKFGGDDASITASIREGRPGTAMVPFKDLITEEQSRQLVFHIRNAGRGLSRVSRRQRSIRTGTIDQVGEADRQARGRRARISRRRGDSRFFLMSVCSSPSDPGRLRIVENGKLLPPVTGTPEVWVRQDGGMFDVEVTRSTPGTDGSTCRIPSRRKASSASPDPAVPLRLRAQPGGRGNQPPSIPSMTVDRARQDQGQRVGRTTGDCSRDRRISIRPPTFTTVRGSFSIAKATCSTGCSATRARPKTRRTCRSQPARFTGSTTMVRFRRTTRSWTSAGAVPSIWSYGHRNPQGFAFDPLTQQALGDRARPDRRRRAEPDRAGQELWLGSCLERHAAGHHQVRAGGHGVAQSCVDTHDSRPPASRSTPAVDTGAGRTACLSAASVANSFAASRSRTTR